MILLRVSHLQQTLHDVMLHEYRQSDALSLSLLSSLMFPLLHGLLWPSVTSSEFSMITLSTQHNREYVSAGILCHQGSRASLLTKYRPLFSGQSRAGPSVVPNDRGGQNRRSMAISNGGIFLSLLGQQRGTCWHSCQWPSPRLHCLPMVRVNGMGSLYEIS